MFYIPLMLQRMERMSGYKLARALKSSRDQDQLVMRELENGGFVVAHSFIPSLLFFFFG